MFPCEQAAEYLGPPSGPIELLSESRRVKRHSKEADIESAMLMMSNLSLY